MGVSCQKTKIFIAIPLSIALTAISAQADCRGCCSRHGGVDCIDGVTQCRDGSSLSSKYRAKGCDKCGSASVSNTQEATDSTATVNSSSTDSDPAHGLSESQPTFKCNGHVAFGIPGPEDQLLCREAYAVGYDYDKKIPAWVAYRLTPDSVNKKFKRSNKFKQDTSIPIQYRSTLSDYRGSGYDRGHMAASATVDSSYIAMLESFLLSNMVPQLPGLNRQGWRYLESYIREWTNERGKLYVVTGVLFEGDHGTIGNGVYVLTHFYKVVYDSVRQDAISFLLPHRNISKSEIPAFIVSVDEIERRTGLDFNRLLDDVIEDEVEVMW